MSTCSNKTSWFKFCFVFCFVSKVNNNFSTLSFQSAGIHRGPSFSRRSGFKAILLILHWSPHPCEWLLRCIRLTWTVFRLGKVVLCWSPASLTLTDAGLIYVCYCFLVVLVLESPKWKCSCSHDRHKWSATSEEAWTEVFCGPLQCLKIKNKQKALKAQCVTVTGIDWHKMA